MMRFLKLAAIAVAALSLAGCQTFTIEGQARATGDGKGVIAITTDGSSGEKVFEVAYTTPPGPEAVYQAQVDKFKEEYEAYNTADKEWKPSDLTFATDTPAAPAPVTADDATADAVEEVITDQTDGTTTPSDLVNPVDPIDPVVPVDPCLANPMAIECGGPTLCDLNPMSPECGGGPDICIIDPMSPECGGGPDICIIDPTSPECGALP
ncbi:hypothetical protein [Yoonia sp.]|uniref:hypothetical protein n=1 Tax=Yoonia sp. TaxID=2212373 RepID=UPI003F6B7C38